MGLDIDFKCKKKSSLFAKGLSYEQFARVLQDFAAKSDAMLYNNGQNKFCLELLPSGFVNIEFKDGYFEGSARTNTVGPGFHKYVVEFLETFAATLKMPIEVSDETAYWQDRDFARLQQEHIKWLNFLIEVLIVKHETALVCWALDSWKPVDSSGFVTPMGRYAKKDLETFLANNDFAREFFIWLNPDRDALYYRGIALFLMWNEFCWVRPRTNRERDLCRRIVSHLEQARTLDPAIPLPLAAWRQVAELSGLPADHAIGPDMDTDAIIGYRRHDIMVPFPGKWEARLPGHFYFETENDGSRVFIDEDRTFRLGTFTVSPDRAVVFHSSLESPCQDGESLVEFEDREYRYKGKYHYEQKTDGNDGYWLLHGQINGPGNVGVVTISWNDDKWRGWAVESFKSIRGPKLDKF